MTTSASFPSVPSIKSTFSCIRCAERKVRCDKQNPCGSCVRHNVQCVFRPPKPSRRKRKLVTDQVVVERLKQYEALLQEKGIDPNQVTTTIPETEPRPKSSQSETPETIWNLPTPASTASGPQATIFEPKLLRGSEGTRFVDNSLWSRVAEEIHDAENASEEASTIDASDDGVSNDDFAYVLGWKTPASGLSHPPPDIIHQLWQTFVENVDPLAKLVHVPSMQPAIEKAATNIERIPKGFEALMFAIYSMAVLSLKADDCMVSLGESKATLLPRYVAATKTALSRAKFMSSTSIVVLQALVLHIFSIRDDAEPRAVWSLTGATIRIAEGMGMRLDGTLLGLSPFETEIHRRIWWQLQMHNFRAAELAGQGKFRDFEINESTPKKPANVNDSDIYPAMTEAPAESTRPTEMVWIMFRTELASFAATQKVKMQKLGKAVFSSEEYVAMDDLKIKDEFIKKLEDMVETKYLRFCDPSQPLQLMTLVGARLSTNLMRFLAHHPRRWAKSDQVPLSEQQFVWSTVLQLLEQYDMMQSSPQLRRFAWNAPYFIQWHAVIHVLDTLRADPLRVDALKAWRLIDALYANNMEMMLNTKKPIVVAVGNLCLKAYSARAAALTKDSRNLPNPPGYITNLQGQRDAARARNMYGKTTLTTSEPDVKWSDTAPMSGETLSEAQLHQPKNSHQGDDAFWLNDALDAGFFASGATDMMNIDTDAILAQDYSFDTSNNEVIDWAQWDAWLGNANPAQPNYGAKTG